MTFSLSGTLPEKTGQHTNRRGKINLIGGKGGGEKDIRDERDKKDGE